MTTKNDDFILKAEHITMRFPGVVALDNVNLYVRKGAVHALMGENGAGKSTLMKVLIGINHPQEGTLEFKGQKIKLENPHDALNAGIAMIHQELSPIPEMTVYENIYLGREETSGFWVKDNVARKKAEELFKRLQIDIDVNEKMKNLSQANKQMVEIAKAISYNASLIIMDEPTSSITEKEVGALFRMIADLKAAGCSIIYITHKMDEVFQIADEITVLRDGQFIDYKQASELDKDSLVKLMVGRDLSSVFFKSEPKIGEPLLSVKHYSRGKEFHDISFDLRKGEVLGFSGLVGAGRSELMMCLFGATKKDKGELYIHGEKVEINNPKDAINHKMAFVTEDRKLTGLYLILPVRDNIIMANLDAFKKGPLLDGRMINRTCVEEIEKYNIKTPSADQRTELLSGGNQQKILLSRWMLTDPDVLILDEPTRGIDIGAKTEIYRLIDQLAAQGKSIIMISSELPEVMSMSDRIIVMHEGDMTGILERKDFSQETILKYSSGELDDFKDTREA